MPMSIPEKPKVVEEAEAVAAEAQESASEAPKEPQAEDGGKVSKPKRRLKAKEPVGATA